MMGTCLYRINSEAHSSFILPGSQLWKKFILKVSCSKEMIKTHLFRLRLQDSFHISHILLNSMYVLYTYIYKTYIYIQRQIYKTYISTWSYFFKMTFNILPCINQAINSGSRTRMAQWLVIVSRFKFPRSRYQFCHILAV